MQSTLKGDLVNAAFSRLRISGLTVQPTTGEYDIALDRLEDMMAEWEGASLFLGYFFEDEPDPNTPHNVARKFHRAIKSNLALAIIADFNKIAPPTLVSEATSSMSGLYSMLAKTKEIAYPSRSPRGSGNTLKSGRWAEFFTASNDVDVPDSQWLYEGDIQDFEKSISEYLRQDETLASADISIAPTSGLTLVSSTVASPMISYRLEGSTVGTYVITINASTSLGRRVTQLINFEVKGLE